VTNVTVPVSVVVCTYSKQRWDDLTAALDSLQTGSATPLEIVVVVDHNPALEERIRSACPQVRMIPNQGSRGLSAARNSGVAAAEGEIVAFLDDDVVVEPDWLARLVSGYVDGGVLGVGGRAVPRWPGERPRWFPPEFDWVVGCSHRGLPTEAAPVRNMIGCNMSFRRRLFNEIEGFKSEIGRVGNNTSGGEETELCIRVARAHPGGRFVYDPSIVVHHKVAPERATWRYFRNRCWSEGRSKALVAEEVGSESGLAAERRHVRSVLPRAAAAGLRETLFGGDARGIVRSAAIAAGTAFAAAGYVAGKLASRRSRPGNDFRPLRILDVELTKPLPDIAAVDKETGCRFGGAFCLVRKEQRPIGVLELEFDGDGISATDLEARLRSVVAERMPDRAAERALPTPPPAISVVVATRDRPASLRVCLDSLLKQDYPAFDIVVVDSAPASSETADLIANHYASTSQIRYVHERRPGLGMAHNCGLKHVDAPIVAFTDDDVIVDPRWLSTLAADFVDDRVACVTGLILPAELETRAQYWTERHGGFGKGFTRRAFTLDEGRAESPLFPYAAGQLGSGANMAFRTDALRRIGGFDPALGAGTLARGGDDLASFVAIVQAGHTLVYDPEALVWHHHRRGEDGMRRQAYGYGVGLGAYLTKIAVDRPAALIDYARGMVPALRHLLSPGSSKNDRLPDDYPAALVWRERLGVLAGALAYLRSRYRVQRQSRQLLNRAAGIAAPGH
jgi:GT2 family glycosyltransferase